MRIDISPDGEADQGSVVPQSIGQAHYCTLLFGPDLRNRVWLAIDDSYVYIDRCAMADLASSENRVTLPDRKYGVPIDLGDLHPPGLPEPVRLKMHQFLIEGKPTIYLHCWFADGTREGSSPIWSAEPASAPIVRFFGPLTFALSNPAIRFTLGAEATKLEVMLRRPGIGPQSFAWHNHSDIPHELHPIATIRFPGKSMAERYMLDRRCCGCRFHTFIDPPGAMGQGEAEVVVSFDDWHAGDVTPATFRIACGG